MFLCVKTALFQNHSIVRKAVRTGSPINDSLFSVQNAFSTYANRYNKVSIEKSGNPGQYGSDYLQVSVQGTLFSGGCVVDDAMN